MQAPVVIAALLASDAGRGAEIIEEWEMNDRALVPRPKMRNPLY